MAMLLSLVARGARRGAYGRLDICPIRPGLALGHPPGNLPA